MDLKHWGLQTGFEYWRSTKTKCLPSGSHCRLPSSSKEANFACNEAAATINEVEGSKTMLEYVLPRGIDREGKGPSN